MEKITKTCFIDGLDPSQYHGDLCAGPSLSSSGAREIVSSCPAKFWANSYMNPEAEREEKEIFDIGTAAHLALLELPEWDARVAVIEADDWRSKAAREERESARERGLTPLLTKHAEKIAAMRQALIDCGHFHQWIKGGISERTFIAYDDVLGLYFKARPDKIHQGERIIVVDYKVSADASPEQWQRRLTDHDYQAQEAWIRSVVRQVLNRPVDRFIFLVQEPKPPYLSVPYEIDPQSLEWGATMNAKAVETFYRCVQADDWPGYPAGGGEGGTHIISLPVYYQMKLEERQAAGAFSLDPKADAKTRKLWFDAQAPDRRTA